MLSCYCSHRCTRLFRFVFFASWKSLLICVYICERKISLRTFFHSISPNNCCRRLRRLNSSRPQRWENSKISSEHVGKLYLCGKFPESLNFWANGRERKRSFSHIGAGSLLNILRVEGRKKRLIRRPGGLWIIKLADSFSWRTLKFSWKFSVNREKFPDSLPRKIFREFRERVDEFFLENVMKIAFTLAFSFLHFLDFLQSFFLR